MSMHYRDLIDRWRLIQYTPMVFTRAAVTGVGRNTFDPQFEVNTFIWAG